MCRKCREAEGDYTFDAVAGPVYRSAKVTEAEAESIAKGREYPHVIDILVWPYPEARDRRIVLRVYYALNLPQAMARAVDAEIRLREQGLKAVLAAVRPAGIEETELFFRALDVLESGLPEPVAEASLKRFRPSALTDTVEAEVPSSIERVV